MRNIIQDLNNIRILVIGDLMLDVYLHGDATRISPEAPVPVVAATSKQVFPGGAANVANNLSAIGCKIELVGFIGKDYDSVKFKKSLPHQYLGVIQTSLPTISKTRILADGHHVVRYDVDSNFSDVPRDGLFNIIKLLSERDFFHAVVVSDYDKGTITPDTMALLKLLFVCPIICDIKPNKMHLYEDVFCIVPNLTEASKMVHISSTEPVQIAMELKRHLRLKTVLITLSQRGLLLLDEEDKDHFFDAHVAHNINDPTKHLDVTGAGDTVLAYFAALVAAGANVVDAARISNVAAGMVVQKVGTAVCSLDEIDFCLDLK